MLLSLNAVFNPLGDNLAPLWDVIALVLTFLVIQALVLVNGALQKRALLPTFITRKVIHIMAAPLFVLCWLLYAGSGASRYFAMVVPLAFIIQFTAIGLGLRRDDAFVNSMSRSGDPRELLGGTLYYAIVMLVCTLLFFNAGDLENPAALYILGALAGGDGLADIIGRRYGGSRSFGLGGARKTPIGSIAMFGGSVLMIALLTALFGTGLSWPAVLLLSLLATVVEALTPAGYDNFTIAAGVLAGIILLQAVAPALWPYIPLLTL